MKHEFGSKLFQIAFLYLALSQAGLSQNITANLKVTWVGNTFSAKDDKFIQHTLWGMYVKPDGTVYGCTYWDEMGRDVGVYRNGNVYAKFKNSHGYPSDGITGDATYIYIGGAHGQVRKYSHDGQNYTEHKTGNGPVRGLHVSGNELYISLPAEGKVKVKDKNNPAGGDIRSFNIPNARDIVEDKSGNLRILQAAARDGSNPFRILHYKKDGTQLPGTITGITHPSALAVNKEKDKLYIADCGSDMDIKIFGSLDAATPVFMGTFGEKGGIQSGGSRGGQFGLKRFNSISSMGIDDNNNLYVANMGESMHARFMDPSVDYGNHAPNTTKDVDMQGNGLILESYNLATGNRNWYVHSIGFCQTGTMDPRNENLFYSPFYKYEMNWAETTPGTGWSLKAFTIDPNKYPGDFRIDPYQDNISTVQSWIQYINNKKFLFMTGMAVHSLWVYRFDESNSGDIAIPCAALDQVLVNGAWKTFLWVDADGDGSSEANERTETYSGIPWADAHGNMWLGGGTQYRFNHGGQLNGFGVPLYSTSKVSSYARPGDINNVSRLRYDSEKDIMYISGFDGAHPDNPKGHWKNAGRVVKRYKNFINGNNRTADASIGLWWDAGTDELNVPVAWDVAGDYIFMTPHKSNFARGVCYAYEIASGKQLGYFQPSADLGGKDKAGWVDLKQGMSAHKRSNGEYVVCVEDNGFYKIILYRWCPSGNCPENTVLSVSPPNPSVCSGSSVVLSAGGANTYSWSPPLGLNITTGANVTANPSSTTTYTVTGVDNSGKTKTATVTVTVNMKPATPQITKGDCGKLVSSATGSNQWYLNGNAIAGATGQSYLPSQSGNYTVEASNGGCKSGMSQAFVYTHSPHLETSCTAPNLTFIIDGKLDEIAWSGPPRDICKVILGNGGNVTAGFKTRWDNQNLYIAADVNDLQLNNASQFIWENSAVELFLDMNNGKTATYENNDFQYIIGWNNPVLFELNNRTTGVQFQTANKTGGYTMEIAIPWTTLGVTPSAGMLYGFDIAIDISHTAGQRTDGLVWSGDANNFQNTSKFGELKLDNQCPPTSIHEQGKNTSFTIYPNPASVSAKLSFILEKPEFVNIVIYDIAGREISAIVDGKLAEGKHEYEFSPVEKGVYFITWKTDREWFTRKIIFD